MKIWEYLAVAAVGLCVTLFIIGKIIPTTDNPDVLKIRQLETEKIVVKSSESGTSLSEIIISANKDGASLSFWTVDNITKSTKLFKIDSRKDGKVYINYNNKERELQEFIHRPRILGESLE